MTGLDPDDGRAPFIQVASVLRARILTGAYQPGEKLPSGRVLGVEFGVARMTMQQAVRILRDEGLLVTRQGSGVFVRARDLERESAEVRRLRDELALAHRRIRELEGGIGRG
jgi:DNA-binding GntR family transcriptional regulator